MLILPTVEFPQNKILSGVTDRFCDGMLHKTTPAVIGALAQFAPEVVVNVKAPFAYNSNDCIPETVHTPPVTVTELPTG